MNNNKCDDEGATFWVENPEEEVDSELMND